MEKKLVIFLIAQFCVTSSSSHDGSHISVDEVLSLFGDNECIEGSMLSLRQSSSAPSVTAMEEDGIPEVTIENENEESITTHQWDPAYQWEPSELEFHNSKAENYHNSETMALKSSLSSMKSKSFLSDFGVKSAMSVVNELSNLLKIPAQYSVTNVAGAPHQRIFNMNLKLGDEEYTATGKNLKEAQHLAARTLLQNTQYQLPLQEIANKIKFQNYNAGMKSPTSLVYEIAAKQKLPVSFEVEDVVGPPHRPTFTTRCILGNKISRGQGSSKKLSKRAAAENMLMQVNTLTSPILDSLGTTMSQVNTLTSPVLDNWGTTKSRRKSRSRKRKSKKRNLLKAFQKMLEEMQTRTTSAANLVSDFLGFSSSNSTYGKDITEQMAKFAKGVLNSDGHFSEEISSKTYSKNKQHQSTQSGEFSSQASHGYKAKHMLMHVAHLLDFEVQFSDLSKGYNGNVVSLLSLSTKQPTLCYGRGSTAVSAHDQAALRALKALSKMDPFMVSSPQGITKENASWKDWSRWVQDAIKEAQGVFLKN